MGSIVQAIQALVTLAVGICTIIALSRKQPPIETTIKTEVGRIENKLSNVSADLYDENKSDRLTSETTFRDHEKRISTLEGTCHSRNQNGKSCAKG